MVLQTVCCAPDTIRDTAAVREQERREQARKDAEAAAQQALINAQQAAEAERLQHERFVGARLCRSKLMAPSGNLSNPQPSLPCAGRRLLT